MFEIELTESAADDLAFLRKPDSRYVLAEIERYLRETVLSSVQILPYDEVAAEWHARERARLAAAGKAPPFVDGQIAAIAKANALVLVTGNRADSASGLGSDATSRSARRRSGSRRARARHLGRDTRRWWAK